MASYEVSWSVSLYSAAKVYGFVINKISLCSDRGSPRIMEVACIISEISGDSPVDISWKGRALTQSVSNSVHSWSGMIFELSGFFLILSFIMQLAYYSVGKGKIGSLPNSF